MAKREDKPNTAKTNAIRKWLRDNGFTATDANAIVKTSLTMSEIDDALRAHLRGRKAKKAAK